MGSQNGTNCIWTILEGGHYSKSTNILIVQNFGASSQYRVFTVEIVLAQSQQFIWLLCSTPKFQIVTNCPNLTPLKSGKISSLSWINCFNSHCTFSRRIPNFSSKFASTFYEDIFPDIPSRTNIAADFDVDVGDNEAIKKHPYRVNPPKRAHLNKEIEYMKENKVNEPRKSEWSSICILVPKPGGSFRFVADFRKVNQCTKTDSYPIPRIDDCIDKIGNA